MRAGMPMLVFPIGAEQPLWADQAKRLKVGLARRFPTVTMKTLIADLRTVLAPEYAARAREISTKMTKTETSVTRAADLLEDAARQRV
jgi:UDP:flavonoid glycosyltransferase YjiC (YdhE family)